MADERSRNQNYDYVVRIGGDASDVKESIKQYFQNAQTDIDKSGGIVIKLNANKKDFETQVKELIKNKPEIGTKIAIEYDDSNLAQITADLEKKIGKTAGRITANLRSEITKGVNKLDSEKTFNDLFKQIMGDGTNKTQRTVSEMFEKIQMQLNSFSFDSLKPNKESYDAISDYVELIERTKVALSYFDSKNHKKLKLDESIKNTFNGTGNGVNGVFANFEKNYGIFFEKNAKTILSNLAEDTKKMQADAFRIFQRLLYDGEVEISEDSSEELTNLNKQLELAEKEAKQYRESIEALNNIDLGKLKQEITDSLDIFDRSDYSDEKANDLAQKIVEYKKMGGQITKEIKYVYDVIREIDELKLPNLEKIKSLNLSEQTKSLEDAESLIEKIRQGISAIKANSERTSNGLANPDTPVEVEAVLKLDVEEEIRKIQEKINTSKKKVEIGVEPTYSNGLDGSIGEFVNSIQETLSEDNVLIKVDPMIDEVNFIEEIENNLKDEAVKINVVLADNNGKEIDLSSEIKKMEEKSSGYSSSITSHIPEEVKSFEELREKVSEVEKAIKEKTQAFVDESKTVATEIPKEIESLKPLIKDLESVDSTLSNISKKITTLPPLKVEKTEVDIDEVVVENKGKSTAKNVGGKATQTGDVKATAIDVSFSPEEFEAVLERYKDKEKEIGKIVEIVKSARKTADGIAESYKLIGEAASITVGLDSDGEGILAARGKYETSEKKRLSDVKNKEKLISDNKKQQISETKQAYQKLYNTEIEYQKLVEKKKNSSINPNEAAKLVKLTKERENYNKTILKGNRLLAEDKDLREKANSYNNMKNVISPKAINAWQAQQQPSFTREELNEINTALARTERLMKNIQTTTTAGSITSVFEQAKHDVEELNIKLQNGDISLAEYDKKIRSLGNELHSVVGTAENWDEAVSKMKSYAQSIAVGEVKIKNLDSRSQRLTATFKDQNGFVHNLTMGFKKGTNQLVKFTDATGKATSLFDKFFEQLEGKWGDLTRYLLSFGGFYEVINIVKQLTTNVIELNSAMTELKKVSDATTERFNVSFENSAQTAKELGATITDTIAATADWSRQGFDIGAAEELAKISILYKNVGDGIDIDEANASIISTLQGFQMEAENALEIVDKFNEVANNFPTSSAGIGTALQRSAASFNAANTDLSESVALIVGANSVLQDEEKVGNMYRTISARIRGASTELIELGEETDSYVESTSKLRDLVKGMTGFDIMQDENTYKSIYDIVVGIGKEYQKLDDIDQAALLEALAGKQQSNALAAALQNVNMIEEAYETAENSAGSASREQQKYSESVQYSIDQLKASIEELSETVISSGALKYIIDFGTKGIESINGLVESVGSLQLLFGAAGSAGLSYFGLD